MGEIDDVLKLRKWALTIKIWILRKILILLSNENNYIGTKIVKIIIILNIYIQHMPSNVLNLFDI